MTVCPYCYRRQSDDRMKQHMLGCANGPLPHRVCQCGGTLVPYSGKGDWLCLTERKLFTYWGDPLDWKPIRV